MSRKSSRRGYTPRPNVIPEQLRQAVGNLSAPQVLTRDQQLEVMLRMVMQLNHMVNTDERMPHLQSRIDRRTDGFSLDIQVVEPVGDDVTVL